MDDFDELLIERDCARVITELSRAIDELMRPMPIKATRSKCGVAVMIAS